MKREEVISKIEQIAAGVAAPAGIEIFEVELKGSGNNKLLRIVIDKAAGVTHADCELISREGGERLDAEDPIPGSYQLEVSSPGVERPLRKWQDWERFQGQKAKVILKEPVVAEGTEKTAALTHFDGVIARAATAESGAHSVTVELAGGSRITFPFEQVSRAHLKFEW